MKFEECKEHVSYKLVLKNNNDSFALAGDIKKIVEGIVYTLCGTVWRQTGNAKPYNHDMYNVYDWVPVKETLTITVDQNNKIINQSNPDIDIVINRINLTKVSSLNPGDKFKYENVEYIKVKCNDNSYCYGISPNHELKLFLKSIEVEQI